VALADERWVDPTAAGSNEKLVRDNLLRDAAAAARFAGLKNAAPSPDLGAGRPGKRLPACRAPSTSRCSAWAMTATPLRCFRTRRTCPMHSIRARPAGCVGMRAPTEPHARLSLNLSALLDSRRHVHPHSRRRQWRTFTRPAAPVPSRTCRCAPCCAKTAPRRGGVGAMREPEDDRTALDKEAIKNSFLDDLFYMQGKFAALATATITTWRSPTPCATGCCSAGSAPRRLTPRRPRARSPICPPNSSWARISATTS
jgi:hypothetical protein